MKQDMQEIVDTDSSRRGRIFVENSGRREKRKKDNRSVGRIVTTYEDRSRRWDARQIRGKPFSGL